MSYFLGFDGGGTKTDCVLVDAQGQALASARGSASNPLRIGYGKTWKALAASFAPVLTLQKISPSQISGVFGGFGGAGRPKVARRIAAFLQRSFPNAVVQVGSDMEAALAAVVGNGEGIVIIAGTGSVAFGRNAGGNTARAGGWGPWIGDEGSAFDVGRRAVSAMARASDGRGPQTALSDQIFKDLRCLDWNELLQRIAKSADGVFPMIFPTVAKVADAGDIVAREILQDAAGSLVDLVRNVAEILKLRDEEFSLGKVGGTHGRSNILDAEFDARLAAVLPRASSVPMAVSPALAAARLACAASSQLSGASISAGSNAK